MNDLEGGKRNEFENLIKVSNFYKERKSHEASSNKKFLIHTVKIKQDLLCRLSLSYIKERKNPPSYLFDVLSIAIEEKENDCAKAIAWFITRTFFHENSDDLVDHIIDVWPALDCKIIKESENHDCSSKVAIVVELKCKIIKLPTNYFSVRIVYLFNDDISVKNTNTGQLGESTTEIVLADIKKITGLSARNLFEKHSKLTLICKSSFQQHGIEKQCVHLFCRVKSLLPIGEKYFPKLFCGLPTQVLQGNPELMTNNLRVGDRIGGPIKDKNGTLGGFVKVRGDTAFLTCLHVILGTEELAAHNISLQDDEYFDVNCYPASETSAASGTPSFVCGKIRDIAFKTDNPESTSIDAALIRVKEGTIICPSDYVVVGKNHDPVSCSNLGMYFKLLVCYILTLIETKIL